MDLQKILFIDRTPVVLPQMLEAAGFQCDLHFDTPREELLKIVDQYPGIVIRSRIKVDRELLEAGQQLRFIGRTGVGVDHIDLDIAAQKGIKVFTTPEGSRDTVGEHAIGLLLCLMNHLPRADHQIRDGQWIREGNRGTEIKGKTIGILGYGNMGQAFAKRLLGFEAEVIVYDKFRKNYGDTYAAEVSLEELWAKSDALSIHIPYTAENHYFINGDFLDRFQKSIFLVNTARGLVLNTEDLIVRLESGEVRGAALDVLEYEEGSFAQLSPDELPAPFQYLRSSEKVVLSPHIAGWSFESKIREAEVLGRKIIEMF